MHTLYTLRRLLILPNKKYLLTVIVGTPASDSPKKSPKKIASEYLQLQSSLFTGREEYITTLQAYFNKPNEKGLRRDFLLYGMGGVGRTQIALAFANRQALEYE